MPEYDMMIRITWMYYCEDKTQSEISSILKMSRQKVQRLLSKAKEQGLVQVKILNSVHNLLSVEGKLRKVFSIHDAVVVPTAEDGEELRRSLARAAANYLSPQLEKISILGLGNGATLSHLPNYFDPSIIFKKNFKVVSLLGNLLRNYSSNPTSIGMKFSDRFGVPYYGLWVPYKLDTVDAVDTVVKQKAVSEVLEIIKKVEISVVGIGSTVNRNLNSGIVNEAEMKLLKSMGAVGDILGRWFNIEGKFVYEELNRRVIGADVKTPGKAIGVAGGIEKAEAIQGALEGNLIDVLVTDESTADTILENKSRLSSK